MSGLLTWVFLRHVFYFCIWGWERSRGVPKISKLEKPSLKIQLASLPSLSFRLLPHQLTMCSAEGVGFKVRAPSTKPTSTNPTTRKFTIIRYHSPLSFPPSVISWLCLFLIFNTTTPLSSLAHPQPKTQPKAQLQPHQHQYLDSPVIAETLAGASEGHVVDTSSSGETVFECNTTAITIEKMAIPGLNEDDKKFIDRIQSSIQTVMAWEKDIELIKACREEIPWEALADPNGPHSDPANDNNLQGNLLFLQRLCRWFKSYMTWVNAPPCQVCGHEELEFQVVRGPETDEEKEGGAARVEGKPTNLVC